MALNLLNAKPRLFSALKLKLLRMAFPRFGVTNL